MIFWCFSPQHRMNDLVRCTNIKETLQDSTTLTWTAVDQSNPRLFTVTWQVWHVKPNKVYTIILTQGLGPKTSQKCISHLCLPALFLLQRTRRGWRSSTITQRWPEFCFPLRKTNTLLTSTTPLQKSSWQPSSVSQSTVSRNYPTTAGGLVCSAPSVRY